MQRSLALTLLVCLAAAPALVRAQPAPPAPRPAPPTLARLAEDLAALRAEVTALREHTVQVPTLAESVREVSDRLSVLTAQVEALAREQGSIPEQTVAMDALRRKVNALADEVSGLRVQLADIEQPHTPGVGGGGGAGHDSGFDWATEDGRFGLTLEGYAQPRWQAKIRAGDDRDDDGWFAENTLRMRRARFGGRGWMGSKKFQWKLEMELVRSPPLLDYYLDYAVRPELVIRAGQFKTQFTRSFITSDAEISFPERPQSIDRLRYDRDLQVGVWGRALGDRLGYFATAGNGTGPNQPNDNIDFVLVGRVDAVVLGKRFSGNADQRGTDPPALMVGGGLTHDLVAVPDEVGDIEMRTDVDGDGTRDNVRVISASADAVVRWKGLEVVGELVYRRENWGTILQGQSEPGVRDLADEVGAHSRRSYLSLYAEASYFVIPHRLMTALRYGHADAPFLGVGGTASALPPGAVLNEYDALVQLYWERGKVLGLSYTYFDFDDDVGGSGPDKQHQLILQAQLRL